MNVLAVAAHGPASAAALIVEGEVVAAAREESFSNRRRDDAFPVRAIRHCLWRARLQPEDLDFVVVPEKPLRKFERVLVGELMRFPHSARSFAREMFRWLGGHLWTKNEVSAEVGVAAERIRFVERHVALACSATWCAAHSTGAVLSADAEGEWASTSLLRCQDASVTSLAELHHPHCLSRLSAAVAAFLDLEGAEGASRLFALAGHARTADRAHNAWHRLLRIDPAGGFELAMDLLGRTGEPGAPISAGLIALLGGPRKAGEPLLWQGEQRQHAELAHGALAVITGAMQAMATHARKLAGADRLYVAGDLVEMPSLLDRLVREHGAAAVHAAPCGGAPAAAIGAALHLAAVEGCALSNTQERAALGPDACPGADQGHANGPDVSGLVGADQIADWLANGDLVGWVRGRLAITSHTLGGRSLLADPRRADAAEQVNRRLKRREPYLPHAACALAQDLERWFDVPPGADDLLDRRLLAVPVRPEVAECIPAVVHGDGTVLVRRVDEARDPAMFALLTAFADRTGVPVLLESTLRLPGEPMVKDVGAARRLFARSAIDHLVAEGCRVDSR